MLLQSVAGMRLPATRQTAGQPDVPGGLLAELLPSQLNPRYYPLVKNSRVFHFAVTFGSLGAFAGAALSSLPIAMYNPPDSGVDAVILQARVGVQQMSAGGAVPVSMGYYGGPQYWISPPTESSNIVGAYGLGRQGGSLVTSFTGYGLQNSLSLICASMSFGVVGVSAALNAGLYVEDLGGSIVCPPGNMLALGNATGNTIIGTFVLAWTWAEIPA